MDDDGITFDDGENYSINQDDKITFKSIVLNHVNRTIRLLSEGDGLYKEQQFITSVGLLADLLHFQYDDDMKKNEQLIRDKLKNIKTTNNNPFAKNINNDDEIIKINMEYFRYLCDFLGRTNYLTLGTIED